MYEYKWIHVQKAAQVPEDVDEELRVGPDKMDENSHRYA